MTRPPLRLITTFGLGYMRPASGTWGSLPPVVVAGALLAAGVSPDRHWWWFMGVQAAMAVVFGVACVAQGDRAEARWGKDPSNAVADETCGQALTLLLTPWCFIAERCPGEGRWVSLGAALLGAFVVFRLLDIIKPWPAGAIQRAPAGWGILLDDVFAGLYAGGLLQLAARLALAD